MDSNAVMEGTSPSVPASDTANGSNEGPQAVKVAVHIRPLIGAEVFQGCKDCVSVVPGEPQVQIGNHSFTFDHVYGSTGSPSSAIFEECVAPLVEGLFQGYNATVLAYGQTGSGKTYTMGTGYTVGGSTEGVIPQVMELIFGKISVLREKSEFQIRVSFIEILKEEVHDLLDPNPPIAVKSEGANGFGSKAGAPGKPPIQIRENTNGEITLAGVTETDVSSLDEMAACLEQGSLCRATASTNMNSRSSRSHAIFTISLEQKRKLDLPAKSGSPSMDDTGDDFLCAKLHLVDLAGSERAKRTGADGVRFKEGVHINKGLLALGNVISALGDDKKRKEGGHVPYRDSKLTRLLQDSLGGNSRTVMIACISPADSNAEETLNTLKYANRARNIQNKPVVNRDPMAAEMQRMRQQVELMQAELLCIRAGGSFEEIQILKQRTAWLEASLAELQQELKVARDNLQLGAQRTLEAEVARDKLQLKLDMLRNGKTWEEIDDSSEPQGESLLDSYAARIKHLEHEIQQLRNSDSRALILSQHQNALQSTRSDALLAVDIANLDMPEGAESGEVEEETVAKELEHAQLQDSLDKELQELNKRLEQKEAEMKTFTKCDGVVLKQHFEKKIVELEEEKKVLQNERDTLLAELASLSNTSDEQSHKMQDTYIQKVKTLEAQILELKKKQENQAQLLKQKQRSDEAAKRLQDEIQRIKSQKVQLQHKIKQESEQFRLWKASREKEVLQLKKEGRRNEYEMHKLQALNQRQKMVLQRKTEEAAMATRRLKELLETRKPAKDSATGAPTANGSSGQANERALQQWLDHELEVAAHIHEVRTNYEKQTDSRSALAKELAKLKTEHDLQTNATSLSSRLMPPSTMSPGAREAKIILLERMLSASSSTLVAMASQLSEAEERERAFTGRARWQHVRNMEDARKLLQYTFSAAADARCRSLDKDLENKELKEKIFELTELLKQSEAHRQERERQQYARDQYIAKAFASALKVGTNAAMKGCMEDLSRQLLQIGDLGPRQLQYSDSCQELTASGDNSPQKASCSSQSGTSTDPEVSEASERESDMDMDIDDDIDDDASDEDWSMIGERRPVRSKNRRSKGDKSQIGSQREVFHTEESKPGPGAQLCCSCSRFSGCKTTKCECKAVGSLCGSNCTCSVKKCANREAGAEEAEAVEVEEAMETLRLQKESKKAQSDSCNEGAGNKDVERAEKVLARHGALVLEDVWNDELQTGLGLTTRKGHTLDAHHKGIFRKPLSDIGNNTPAKDVGGQPPMTKQRKHWAKALVQLVPTANNTASQHANSVDVAAVGSHTGSEVTGGQQLGMNQPTEALGGATPSLGLEAATAVIIPAGRSAADQATQNNDATVRSAADQAEGQGGLHTQNLLVRDGPVHFPGKLPLRNVRKRSSPPSSPLRARNAGGGAVEEAGPALTKRPGYPGSSMSPRGPGRGAAVQEKENA